MEKLVKFFTKSGWFRYVRFDDYAFSGLLEPYKELGVDVPDEIELVGSVGDIISSSWVYYMRLKEMTDNFITKLSTVYDAGSGVVNLLTQSRYLDLEYDLKLRDLLNLSRILNFPARWELFVSTDEHDSSVERKAHILRQGDLCLTELQRPLHRCFSKDEMQEGHLTNFHVFYLRKIAKEETLRVSTKTGKDANGLNELQTRINRLFYGTYRNTLLRSYFSPLYSINWDFVDWGELEDSLREIDEGSKSRKTITTMQLLSGRTRRNVTRYVPIGYSFRPGPCNTYLTDLKKIKKLPILYDRVLASIVQDIGPMNLGLDLIITVKVKKVMGRLVLSREEGDVVSRFVPSIVENPFYPVNDLLDMVEWVNYSTICYFQHHAIKSRYCEDSDKLIVLESDFVDLVKLMGSSTIGRYGLSRILLSLLHSRYITLPRVNLFARTIEQYLETNTEESQRLFVYDFY